MPKLLRRRLIPDELVPLDDDYIVSIGSNYLITAWQTFRPKDDFSHGVSMYLFDQGWKISRFLKEDGSLCYIYCDIIKTDIDKTTDSYLFTDLLADVIIDLNDKVHVVDLDELADAFDRGLISKEDLSGALRKLDALLATIYSNQLNDYLRQMDEHTHAI